MRCDARKSLDTAIFFFQPEDGIRDETVTGVQTCALPIYLLIGNTARVLVSWVLDSSRCRPEAAGAARGSVGEPWRREAGIVAREVRVTERLPLGFVRRSEERRVGKGCRSRCACND